MIVTINPDEPENWLIGQVTNVLRKGGVVVVPASHCGGSGPGVNAGARVS